jgi:hypothetical protein
MAANPDLILLQLETITSLVKNVNLRINKKIK